MDQIEESQTGALWPPVAGAAATGGTPAGVNPDPGQSAPPEISTGARLTSWGGFVLVTAATTVAGLIDHALFGALGWITGVVFVLTSALTAIFIRPKDLATAVIGPPIAFLLAALISAQPWIIGSAGNIWLLQATSLVTSLAFNAPWLFAGTIAALVIVLVRASRLRAGRSR